MILTPHRRPFLGPPDGFADLTEARVVIVPFGFEGGVSYGRGAGAAPQAVLEASQQVEFYDEELDLEPYRIGIATIDTPPIPEEPLRMLTLLQGLIESILAKNKMPLIIGGDHSITTACLKALSHRHPRFGVLQLDAHADLRNDYLDNPYSHACSMARALEITPHTLQIGIRSMAVEEAQRVKTQALSLCTMRRWRSGSFDFLSALAALPDQVYLTLDVDVLDWSVVAGTGTPEPGGMLWHEVLDLLRILFAEKDIIGCDVVELSPRPGDINSPFAVAKLIHKMIGYQFADELKA